MVERKGLPKYSVWYTMRQEIIQSVILGGVALLITLPFMTEGHEWDCGVYACPNEMYEHDWWMTATRFVFGLILGWVGLRMWLEFRARRIMNYRREITLAQTARYAIPKEAGTVPTLLEMSGLAVLAYTLALMLKLFSLFEWQARVLLLFLLGSPFYMVRETMLLRRWQPSS